MRRVPSGRDNLEINPSFPELVTISLTHPFLWVPMCDPNHTDLESRPTSYRSLHSSLRTPPPVSLPPDLMPVGFQSYRFGSDPARGHSLALPTGGITFNGEVFVYGFRVLQSEELPPLLNVIVSRGRKGQRRHLSQTGLHSSLGETTDRMKPVCDQVLKSWMHAPNSETPIVVCTKSGRGSDTDSPTWCNGCVYYLRRISGGGQGRAAHVILSPFPDSTAAESSFSEGEQNMLVCGVVDVREYENPDYGYCAGCKQPYHRERDDSAVTDWFGRVVG